MCWRKDLDSFGQDSELFTSAATTLLELSFPEKAVKYLKQLHTLGQARSAPKTVSNQNFPKVSSQHTVKRQYQIFLKRQYQIFQKSQPYSRGGYNSLRGREATSIHHSKVKMTINRYTHPFTNIKRMCK